MQATLPDEVSQSRVTVLRDEIEPGPGPTRVDRGITVVRVADQWPIGLATNGVDHRCESRAEMPYRLLPAACGEGLGREAVAAAVSWWTDAVPGGGPLVAVTQKASRVSCRMLEAIGMTSSTSSTSTARASASTPPRPARAFHAQPTTRRTFTWAGHRTVRGTPG
ncbi:GNAT family N-acetyltransferase [Streptomyces sp. NPDC127079]|uniref:GNAT family N-acetyltransferase n=1 Tax=Streptomyces sp. NPDC127079 TaxID=3347132 RepID=UPI00365BA6F7